MTREQARAALVQIANAIVETVKEAGDQGTPGGVLYAAMMAHGASLEQFEQLMAALVAVKKLRKRGDLYFAA